MPQYGRKNTADERWNTDIKQITFSPNCRKKRNTTPEALNYYSPRLRKHKAMADAFISWAPWLKEYLSPVQSLLEVNSL